MTAERFIVVQYCDDIRQEVGNKLSLMGCYSGDLLVEKLPAVLPKLCVQIKVITPRDLPFEKIVLRAFLNEDQVGELEVPVQDINRSLEKTIDPEVTRMTLSAIMSFSPLVFEKEGVIRIEAETEMGVIRRGGRMRLLLAETHLRSQQGQ